ncbi:MAG: TonB family protein [Xanthomonadales bacterium]|nr:TonB family protein [Xanthomonadales bacterium]
MRALFVSSLLLIPLLCSCASMDTADVQAKRLGAPSIPTAEECPGGIDSQSLPRYPREALGSRTEGWVVVEVELSSDGQVLSRRIESEKPSGVFSQAALDSIDSNTFSRSASTRKCKMLYTFGLDQ